MLRWFSYLVRLWNAWKYVEEPDDPVPAPRVRRSSFQTAEEEFAELKELALRTKAKVERFRRDRCETLARSEEASLRHIETRIHSIEAGLRRAA